MIKAFGSCTEEKNPVIESAEFILKDNPHVQLSLAGIEDVADELLGLIQAQNYTPNTWRTQPTHFLPPTPFDAANPRTKQCIDWIFLVSALNFSFWSEHQGLPTRYGVSWKSSWDAQDALEKGIPITDPVFYASEESCPDALIEEIFAPVQESQETISLLPQRIAIMREVGKVLVKRAPNQSFFGILESINANTAKGHRTIALLQAILEYFPCFRDSTTYKGHKVYFWKRAQILVAELWAAFYPLEPSIQHPIIPDGVDYLTMFADYRVPQILHHLGTLTYSEELEIILSRGDHLEYGSEIECSIRAGSILAVEQLKARMVNKLNKRGARASEWKGKHHSELSINCVLIDFFLWDLAKLVEAGEFSTGRKTAPLACHRTRSIFY
ncbi:UPF0553 protein v1g230591 [Serendipita indica DSM 11827]|uniref:Queuosine 5'-phosphate N-glycosylase/hydrolase n=1 Tax=Serendipita indica (strain DSM 11827) TaxID=1109443 RepID=G4TD94_SERID|nr:UPF0553 protein v1g230591 [Serendipita indica DSM 11827]CCA69276.1 hypothetical protein PIIN_03175 [Serendipita indica DSM 11827]